MASKVVCDGGAPLSGVFDVSTPNIWQASVKKSLCDFDAIVVGSGIGGLTCASLLAKHRFKVLVLEQHFQVGGFCSSFKWRGFTFTSGVEDVSGVDDGKTGRLLKALDLKKDDLFVLNRRLFVIGDKKLILDGTKEGTISALCAAFPDAADAIRAFLDEVDSVLHGKDPELLKNWKSVKYQEKLDQFFREPELKAFFCSLLGYMGAKADQVPAASVVGACLSYFVVGGYYPKGGPQHVADMLRDYVTEHGGTVMTRARVDEVVVANEEVQGVRVGQQTFSSGVVIGNVNAKMLFTKLIPAAKVHKAYVDAIAALPMSMSLCMVQVGTDLDLSHLPSHIQVLDPEERVHCVINSNADPSLAPKGMSSITFLCRGDYHATPERQSEEYERYKEEKKKMVLLKAERVFPGLRDHILEQDVSTPRTFERYTSMPEGAIYAFDQGRQTARPYFKTPIRGLYLSSASTSRGGGISAVVSAGFQCAEDIVGYSL